MTTKSATTKTIFSIFSFIFVLSLFIIIVYETKVTEILPSEETNKKKMEYVDKQYGSFGLEHLNISLNPANAEVYSQEQRLSQNVTITIYYDEKPIVLDEDEEFEDEDRKYKEGMNDEEDDD